jgi:copper transport protein
VIKRVCVLLLGLLGAGLLLAAPAAAHATVVTSSPADGSRLKAVPHTITITFDENVGLGNVGYLHVTNQVGKRVDAKAAYHPGGDGTKVADDLTSGLGDGTYTASFRVVSADSHPVAGTIRFVVGSGALVHGSAGGSAVNHGTSEVFDLVRWISYAGLALLGGVWLLLTFWPAGRDDRRARAIVWTGWGGATLGAALELLLQGPYSAGAGLSKIASSSLIDDTLHTDYGQLHCVRLVLLGLMALIFARSLQADARPARWEAVVGVLFVGVAWSFSDAGHGATTSPSWLSVPVDMLHVLAMATWIGGLVMLVGAVLPRREPDELREVLPIFSKVAFTSVVVLAASGTYAAFRGIGTINAIFTTNYGLLVVFKVVLLIGILSVASLSRRLVHQRSVAYAMTDNVLDEAAPESESDSESDADGGGDEDAEDAEDEIAGGVATERLRRAVFVEALIGLAVLGFSAVLVAQPRGKEALVASYREPVSASTSLGGGRTVTVTADPGTHGPVNLTVELSAGATPTLITATATQNAKEIGPIAVKLTRESAGVYDGSTSLPVAGAWEIDLVVTTSTFDATTTDVTVHLH